MTQHLLTEEGLEFIKKELQVLLQIRMPANIRAISEASALGDLKENSEYHSAKEENAVLNSMIAKYTFLINNSVVINPALYPHHKVMFGSSVILVDHTGNEVFVKIVSCNEANFITDSISITSPLARKLIGKTVGDHISMGSLESDISYKIIKISH